MALATYADLQSAVGNWLARSDLSAYIPDFITLAEADINRRLRVRQMETTGDLTVDGQTVALPTGFIGMRRLYLSANPIVRPVYIDPEAFWERYLDTTAGRPVNYTIEGDNISFGPIPDATYTGKLLYWKRQDLSVSAHTLFTQNPDLYLYGSLAHSAPFIGDDGRVALWAGVYANMLDSIQASDERDRWPAGGATMTASGVTVV